MQISRPAKLENKSFTSVFSLQVLFNLLNIIPGKLHFNSLRNFHVLSKLCDDVFFSPWNQLDSLIMLNTSFPVLLSILDTSVRLRPSGDIWFHHDSQLAEIQQKLRRNSSNVSDIICTLSQSSLLWTIRKLLRISRNNSERYFQTCTDLAPVVFESKLASLRSAYLIIALL